MSFKHPRTLATTTIAALATLLNTAARAETVEGLLEKGATYSALFSVSPESGDLVGYAFKNASPAGKAILQNCLSGMLCKVQKAASRILENTSLLTFTEQPMGWYEITKAQGPIGVETLVHGYESAVKTRFGTVSVRDDDKALLFKGKPVQPAIEGNSNLHIVARYEWGADDVLLLQDTGGSACPAQFRILQLSAKGLKTSPAFGTCSDLIYPSFDAKTGVTVAMVGFAGPFESAAAQKKAGMSKAVYRWDGRGTLLEKGRVER